MILNHKKKKLNHDDIVLVVSLDSGIGGAEFFLNDLLFSLPLKWVLLTGPRVSALLASSATNSNNIVSTGWMLQRATGHSRLRSILRYMRAYFMFAIFLSRIKSSFRVCYLANGFSVLFAPVLKMFGYKVILHVHHEPLFQGLSAIFFKFFCRYVDDFIVPSEFLVPILGQKHAHVIPNGISNDWWNRKNEHHKLSSNVAPKVAIIGAVYPVKNQELFVSILRDLKVPVRGIICGPIKDECYLRKINTLAKERGVVFEHVNRTRAEMPQFLSDLDVLVVCSLTEVLPLCILEAGALGIPTVAWNVGGVGDVLKRFDIDVLPYNSPSAAFARKIEEIIVLKQDEKITLKRRMVDKMKSDFSIDVCAGQISKIIYGNVRV